MYIVTTDDRWSGNNYFISKVSDFLDMCNEVWGEQPENLRDVGEIFDTLDDAIKAHPNAQLS